MNYLRNKYPEHSASSGEKLFVISGVLENVYISSSIVNLLDKFSSNVDSKSLVSGATAILSGMHGVVANSSSLLFYEGEEVHSFIASVGGEVVAGSFRHGEHIGGGDSVIMVASRRGEVNFVHAVMNNDTKEFYMPINTFASFDGMFNHCMRVAFWFTILSWVFLLSILASEGFFSDKSISIEKFWSGLVMFLGIPAFMSFSFEYWTYRSLRGADDSKEENYATQIFRSFGFKRPNKIDLTRDTSISMGEKSGWYGSWKADRLLPESKL